MAKSLVIAEEASLATLMDRDKAVEFFFQSNDFALGDIYSARVENILPSIDAVFVNLGSDKMGFLHASDIPGTGPLSERIWPKQKLLVQIVKEPTGNKGPRVSNDITLIGRFFVLTTEHNNIVMSRRIASAQERARLRSIATLLKPPVGFGLIIRTEAMGTSEAELEEDFRELFLERWKYIIDQFEIQRRPNLIFSDSRDLLYRVLRDVFHDGVDTVAVDNPKAAERAKHYLELWSHKPPEVITLPTRQLLRESGVLSELKAALSHRIELPNGGYVHIQATEAMTVVDVNSGKFTSSRSPGETVLKTNLEAATEVARQLRLRNIGGVIVIDFIDMDNKFDRLKLLEHFERLLENDPARPQIGRLSDLGLVELTRHRQEKSLLEALGHQCDKCHGLGWTFHIFDFAEEEDTPFDEHHSTYSIQEPEERDFQEKETITSQDPLSCQFPEVGMVQETLPDRDTDEYNKNEYNQRGRQGGRYQQDRHQSHSSKRNLRDGSQQRPRQGRFGQTDNRFRPVGGAQLLRGRQDIHHRRGAATSFPNESGRERFNERNSKYTSVAQLEDALLSGTPIETNTTSPSLEPRQEIIPGNQLSNSGPRASEFEDRRPPEQPAESDTRLNEVVHLESRPEESYQTTEVREMPIESKPEIVFPRFSLGDSATKEVLPGIFSFSKDDE